VEEETGLGGLGGRFLGVPLMWPLGGSREAAGSGLHAEEEIPFIINQYEVHAVSLSMETAQKSGSWSCIQYPSQSV